MLSSNAPRLSPESHSSDTSTHRISTSSHDYSDEQEPIEVGSTSSGPIYHSVSLAGPTTVQPPTGMTSALDSRSPESWRRQSSAHVSANVEIHYQPSVGSGAVYHAPQINDSTHYYQPMPSDQRAVAALPSTASSSSRPHLTSRPSTGTVPSFAPSYHPYQSPKPRQPAPSAASILFINSTTTAAGGFDGSGQIKQKRKRILPEQLEHLCALFDKTDSPSYDAREDVARKVAMTNREVQVWFQNRRAKVLRQKQAEMGPPKSIQTTPSTATSPGPPPAPLKAYTSRFAAASESHPLGEHSWRVKTQAVNDSPVTPELSIPQSSFRAPPGIPAGVSPRPSGLVAASPSEAQSSPYSRAYRVGRAEEEEARSTFYNRPSPSLSLAVPVSASPSLAYRSPGASSSLLSPSLGVGYSPYGAILSPSTASSYGGGSYAFGTPSSYSTSGSSYFSGPEGPPYSPSSLSSPGGSHFIRLTLDSPATGMGCSPRESPYPGAFESSPQISQARDGAVHLPPILSPEIWDERHREQERERQKRGGAHGRSLSDGEALSHEFSEQVNRSRNVVMSVGPGSELGTSPALDCAQSPERRPTSSYARRPHTSPSFSSSRAQADYSSQIAADHSRRIQNLHTRSTRTNRPSSLSHSLPAQLEEAEAEQHHDPRHEPIPQDLSRRMSIVTPALAEPLGLGMLAVAASESMELGEAEDEAERKARERYLATRRLSIAP